MSRRMSYADAKTRIIAVLDAPRDRPISPDFFPGTRESLLSHLIRDGRSGFYGEYFEDLTNPHALNVPGVQPRTDKAIMDAITELGMTVVADYDSGQLPAFGIGGDYAGSDRVAIQGVCLALATLYMKRGDVPTEFAYAAQRVAASGTHANGTAYRIANKLRKIQRDNPEGVR